MRFDNPLTDTDAEPAAATSDLLFVLPARSVSVIQTQLFSAKPEPNKQAWLTCCTYTNPDVNVLLHQMTVCM